MSGKGKEKDHRWFNKIRVVPKEFVQVPAKVSEKVHNTVYEALYEEKMLLVDYQPREKKTVSQRRIHPLALIYRGITSELVVYEEGDSTIKRFLLNRIKKASIQIQSVIIPKGFNLNVYIEAQLGFPGSGELIEFKAWIHESARQNVEETPLSHNQTIQEVENGNIIVTTTLRETASLTAWILGLNNHIKVLEPEELQEKIIELIEGMIENYR